MKDAYHIVRENQLMKEDPAILDAPEAKAFLATSPPAASSMMSPPTPMSPMTALVKEHRSQASSPVDSPANPTAQTTKGGSPVRTDSEEVSQPFISQVGILPSSMPNWWNAHMEALRSGKLKEADDGASERASDGASDHGIGEKIQSAEQQAETARRLKPPGRGSTTALYGIQDPNPEATATAIATAAQKKERRIKFQFGIRSKSNPSEAMLVIYSTLLRLGGEWEQLPTRKVPVRFYNPAKEFDHSSRRDGSSDSSRDLGRTSSHSRREGSRGRERDQSDEFSHLGDPKSHESDANRSRKKRKPNDLKVYEVPIDPWLVRARFRKDGMAPPGILIYNSARSSLANLTDLSSKRDSGNPPSTSGHSTRPTSDPQPPSHAHSTHTSLHGSIMRSTTDSMSSDPRQLESCYVKMDIQIYTMPESKNYVVDFRCPGYGRIGADVDYGDDKGKRRTAELRKRVSSHDFDAENRQTVQCFGGYTHERPGRQEGIIPRSESC